MALLLALSSNIGVGGMVTGFRQTFLDWLDERLVAELYFETASRTAASEIEEWARHQPNISAILPVWRTKTRIQGWPIEIMGMRKHETYSNHFPLLQAHDAVWNELQETDAILISEQLSHRLKLGVGAFLELPTPNKNWRVKIVGVFSDYGNPKGQIRIDHERLIKHFSDTSGTHYSLRVAPDSIKTIIEQLHQTFGAKIIRVVDQAEVKTISKEIFERTFTITTALNTLTLIVSAVALFSSLITLSNLRLTQIAPVWAIGITISALARLELIRILLFSACVAIMAIPLGLFLSWGLVTIINVLAFGWRLPMHFFPLQWMIVFLIALLTGLFAAIAPVMRLSKSTPASLLKAFSNER
jgi:putative ABC transport system permease protein